MPYKKVVSRVDDIVGNANAAPATSQPQRPSSFVQSDNQNNGGHYNNQGPTEEVSGILDVQPEGHGFLRPKFIPSYSDVYISQSQIRRFLLRPGDLVAGLARLQKTMNDIMGC